MTSGMTRYEKIAISLPSRCAEHVRRAVKRGDAPSVSAYITAAIEERAAKRSLKEILDEDLEATGGPTTPEEKAWLHYVMGLAPPGSPKPPQPASLKGLYRYEPKRPRARNRRR